MRPQIFFFHVAPLLHQPSQAPLPLGPWLEGNTRWNSCNGSKSSTLPTHVQQLLAFAVNGLGVSLANLLLPWPQPLDVARGLRQSIQQHLVRQTLGGFAQTCSHVGHVNESGPEPIVEGFSATGGKQSELQGVCEILAVEADSISLPGSCPNSSQPRFVL